MSLSFLREKLTYEELGQDALIWVYGSNCTNEDSWELYFPKLPRTNDADRTGSTRFHLVTKDEGRPLCIVLDENAFSSQQSVATGVRTP